MSEKINYKVVGPVNITDAQGNVQGTYAIGHVYEFDKEIGDLYLEQGLVELVSEEVEAPVEAPEETPEGILEATQSAQIETAKYKILEEVAIFNEIAEVGTIVDIAVDLGDKLVEDKIAEKVD